jgi:hypothetical protein
MIPQRNSTITRTQADDHKVHTNHNANNDTKLAFELIIVFTISFATDTTSKTEF